ncbi:MAG: 4-hydroxy-tetrahydrodipicolinate synthase [Deltaproteobacteria bacterium]|nr:4-hydroxy-tetrahydrodipicolinate synthase [Deltaproteobacteria bacterium]
MFRGVYTALVTPFKSGAVDEAALVKHVEDQIAAGVDGVVPCGSTGEAATLSHEEHKRVVELVVRTVAWRVRVIAGTGSNATAEAIELTAHAKQAGADGALLISPYYNKPTPDGVVAHYAAVANATQFPLVAYNVPGRTGSNVQPDTIARLAEIEHVVGVKESSGDLHQISQVIARVPSDFAVLAGDDWATLPQLAIGGAGVISTCSNLVPREMCELVHAFRRGDLARARELHYRLLPLCDSLFCETNPIPIKAALAMRGKLEEELRLPLVKMTAPNKKRLELAMKEFGGLL